MSSDMTGKGMRIFKEIFTRDPETKALFPFRNARMEDLPNDVKFRGHASRSGSFHSVQKVKSDEKITSFDVWFVVV